MFLRLLVIRFRGVAAPMYLDITQETGTLGPKHSKSTIFSSPSASSYEEEASIPRLSRILLHIWHPRFAEARRLSIVVWWEPQIRKSGSTSCLNIFWQISHRTTTGAGFCSILLGPSSDSNLAEASQANHMAPTWICWNHICVI